MLFWRHLNKLIYELRSETKEEKQTSMYLIVHTVLVLKTVYVLVYF